MASSWKSTRNRCRLTFYCRNGIKLALIDLCLFSPLFYQLLISFNPALANLRDVIILIGKEACVSNLLSEHILFFLSDVFWRVDFLVLPPIINITGEVPPQTPGQRCGKGETKDNKSDKPVSDILFCPVFPCSPIAPTPAGNYTDPCSFLPAADAAQLSPYSV